MRGFDQPCFVVLSVDVACSLLTCHFPHLLFTFLSNFLPSFSSIALSLSILRTRYLNYKNWPICCVFVRCFGTSWMGDTYRALSKQVELKCVRLCTDGICVSPWEIKLRKYIGLSSGWGFAWAGCKSLMTFCVTYDFILGYRELMSSWKISVNGES